MNMPTIRENGKSFNSNLTLKTYLLRGEIMINYLVYF